MLEDGWRVAADGQRAAVVDLLNRLGGSRNATANALGVTVHGVRRVLDRLPSRPEEADALARVLECTDVDNAAPSRITLNDAVVSSREGGAT